MAKPASLGQTEAETDPSVLKNLEYYQDLKFGLMIHWGVYSLWGAVESWPICDAEPYGRDVLPQWDQSGKNVETFMKMYFDLNTQFNPAHFEADVWADAADDAGMKYLIFTSKHHDGFCMYDTRQTDYRTTHPSCPFHKSPRADVTKVLFDAFRQRDFKIGVYYSKADWHNPHYWNPAYPRLARQANYDLTEYPAEWAAYVDFLHTQIRELMTGYGPIDILWLDSDWVKAPREDINMPGLAGMAREHQQGLIIVDRAVGGRYENYKTPEQTVPDAYVEGVWESCLTMGEQWSYNPTDKYKSVRQIIHTLVQVIARGGNLLLNVGPDPQGRLPEKAIERLAGIGRWVRINAEALYGTRATWPYEQGKVCLTKKNDIVYAILLAEDDQTIPPMKVTISGIHRVETVRMLGTDQPVAFQIDKNGLTVSPPESMRHHSPCEHAWTFALTGAEFKNKAFET
jgi:alpha-L-fucosidase